ncbi:hypothetical protein CHUAL_008682 [Chamberlinius hualienensis]
MDGHSNGHNELDIIKGFHDEAYSVIDMALSSEEANRTREAAGSYENGLRLLEQALSVQCDKGHCNGDNWDKCRFLQMKMRKTREEVLARLSALSKQRSEISTPCAEDFTSEMPPSYEEATSPTANGPGGFTRPPRPPPVSPSSSKSFYDVCHKLPVVDGVGRFDSVPSEAETMFNIPKGVQVFFVSANGDVSAPSYPTALTIYKLSNDNRPSTSSSTNRMPPAFLEVGEWVYPLIPGQMPVLHTTYGAYIFPDTNSITPGAAVGLLLTDGISEQDRQIFEHLMCELTALKMEIVGSAPGERRMSAKISDGIVTGAEMLSKGMIYGAEKTSEYIKYAALKLRERIEPACTPTSVDPNVQRGLKIARDVSDVAMRVSGYLINQLGRATMALGQQLAPHVRKQGAILLAKAFGEEQQPLKSEVRMNDVMEVASGGLKGFSTVYLALQESAKLLANSLIAETVTTVNYKYGADAASTTGDGLHTVGNVAYTAYNVNNMGIKAIAKKTATDTGKALIQQHKNPPSDGKHDENSKGGP